MFTFSSIGEKIDNKVNTRPGPYIFWINDQNHHRMGSLLPIEGVEPKFTQLYIYNIENKVNNRIKILNSKDDASAIDCEIVEGLIKMFNQKIKLLKLLEW